MESGVRFELVAGVYICAKQFVQQSIVDTLTAYREVRGTILKDALSRLFAVIMVKKPITSIAHHSGFVPPQSGAPAGVTTPPARQPSASPGGQAVASRSLAEPPPRRDGFTAWLVMLLCMLAAAPAVLIDLYRPEVTDAREAHALATSIHSWTRTNSPKAAGETFIESLIPHYNGKRQWRESPGITWTQMLAFQLIASKPVKELNTEASVDTNGKLVLPPPYSPITATGLVPAEVQSAIRLQARTDHKYLDVRVKASVKKTNAEAAAPASDPAAVPADKRPLQIGDQLNIEMSYVEPDWRTQVSTISLIKYGRLASALMGLITIAAVFWAGHSIGGVRAGLFSALICAANPVFIWHARLASPPIHQAMWAMLSIAAALWAIRPLRASPSIERQFLGWVLCGLSLGGATLTIGPIAAVTVVGPIVLLLLLCPHRSGHFMGLTAAVIIGVLLVMPWTVLLHNHDPNAAEVWWNEHQPFGMQSFNVLIDNLGARLLLVLLAIVPWTIWLTAAVVQPFSISSVGSRTRLFLGFTWFLAATFIMLMQPSTQDIGSLLPLVPAGAVMLGQLFHHYSEMAGEGRFARFWRVLRWPHILLLAWISVMVPMVIAFPQPFIEKGWFAAPFFDDPGWGFTIGLGAVLLALVGLAARQTYRHSPGGALGITAAWMLLLSAVIAIPASRSPHARSLVRKDAATIAEFTHDLPIFAVQGDAFSPGEIHPAILLYTGAEIRAVGAKQIDEVAAKQKTTIYLLSRAEAAKPTENAELVTELKNTRMRLWKVDALAEAAVMIQRR